MEMPSVQIPVPGVLNENLDDQLDAVWNVLNVRRFSPPDAAPTRIVNRSGTAAEPAVVLTDVLKLNGTKLIKPFLIGLPNRRNVLFDFDRGNLTSFWSGDTARQRTQGKTWFWEPGTKRILPTATDPEFALFTGDQPTVSVKRGQFMTEPDAWHRVENGISVQHRIHFPNADSTEPRSIQVTQRVESTEDGFLRSVSFAGLDAEESIGIRAALDATAAAASLKGDYFVTIANERGRAEIELRYVSEPADEYRSQQTPPTISKLKELDVMPGFAARQLPLRSDIMPISLAWMPDGKLVFGSLKGRVWLAEDSDGDGNEDSAIPISDDLAAPYGLHATKEYIDALNKYGVVRIHLGDNGDVVSHELVAAGWGHTDDYHDWVVGLPIDKNGNYYVSIPCQQDDRSVEAALLRGSVLKLAPRKSDLQNPRKYDLQQLSFGHRFPMGIAMNSLEQIFVTDNQGNYNPYNELNHVVKDAHFGFINKLQRNDGNRPPLTAPAIDIPHPWTRSVNGICFLESPAGAERTFGPFEGHLVGCEYDTRRLIRMSIEEVEGHFQGAVYPFAEAATKPENGFQGPVNCRVSPNGDLYIANIRDSGWGGANNTGSIVRISPQLDELPAGIREVSARSDGFVIRFTKPINKSLAEKVENYSVASARRISTPAYGGDDGERRRETISRVDCASDAMSVRLVIPKLRAGFVYEFRLRNLKDESSLFYPSEGFYTLRRIPRK